MIHRIYVEKKKEYATEASARLADFREFLGIRGLTDVRLLNRYDYGLLQNELDAQLALRCREEVFSDPLLDIVTESLPADADRMFATALLPGQFDQRADSAQACIRLLQSATVPDGSACLEQSTQVDGACTKDAGDVPFVRCATVWLLYGSVFDEEFERIKRYVINSVESKEISIQEPPSLPKSPGEPLPVALVDGFRKLDDSTYQLFLEENGLAMDAADLALCCDYFRKEQRDPTVAEMRMIDTYWSDHCRHTTFHTAIEHVEFLNSDAQKAYDQYMDARASVGRSGPVTLMDLATINAKVLKNKGMLNRLDESDEVNACTVIIDVDVEGQTEPWLLYFKNETHNHPTEIEPFGGASTCLGGAIRDPLSGRAYVYAAMRLSGAADPRTPWGETLMGKLPQRTLVRSAAAGYSSYGNQIGVPAGLVHEWYHPGFVAKRLEAGAVIAACPASNVVRSEPVAGDIVLLLGGRTGRDGLGGATGSSKSHSIESQESGASEVQRGNAPVERRIMRLFSNGEATKLIKRCNDFGAGGVSVAVGELAGGLHIELDAVPVKYGGLDGMELAISESQERMAVVVAKEHVERFLALAAEEHVEATEIARVTDKQRLVMEWQGARIVDIDRSFLDTNGAQKKATARVEAAGDFSKDIGEDFACEMKKLISDINACSISGLTAQFDASVGGGTVLAPLGGTRRKTPPQAMVHKVFDPTRDVRTCSLMAWGYNPYILEKDPYRGAYMAVVESVAKLIATGGGDSEIYLSFQEYFERLGRNPARWGKPIAALLGAYRAQDDLGIAAIGGKDSMSGTFEDLHVPPTLISFAVTTAAIDRITSPEFKEAGRDVYWVRPAHSDSGLPDAASLVATFDFIKQWMREESVCAAATPGYGGVAEAVFRMASGNGLGFEYDPMHSLSDVFDYSYGSFVIEAGSVPEDVPGNIRCDKLGHTIDQPVLMWGGEILDMQTLLEQHESVLESTFPTMCSAKRDVVSGCTAPRKFERAAGEAVVACVKAAHPKVFIPIFSGTNGEWDMGRAAKSAGFDVVYAAINDGSPADIASCAEQFASQLRKAHVLALAGGACAGDEPDGAGKWIASFLRLPVVQKEIEELLQKRGGLVLGVGNGFQALVRTGLLPFGRMVQAGEQTIALAKNEIGTHVSGIVRVHITSNKGPWLSKLCTGDVYNMPVSCSEGRIVCDALQAEELINNGQIVAQYVDSDGLLAGDMPGNPTGSMHAIEALISPDGRVLGKMGHCERSTGGTFINVPGCYDMPLFESARVYFR